MQFLLHLQGRGEGKEEVPARLRLGLEVEVVPPRQPEALEAVGDRIRR